MPILSKAYKLKCPKCRYKKIVPPQGDARMSLIDDICPKCKTQMKRKELSMFETLGKGWGYHL